MLTTTRQDRNPTITRGGSPVPIQPNELCRQYDDIIETQRLNWTTYHSLKKLLGSGGQGVVYLTERRGVDGFTLPVALKIFSPERYLDAREYEEAMTRIARVASRVAQIQHDNLLGVQNFVDRHRIRMMVMEWIDGYDLHQLLTPSMLDRIEGRVSAKRWEYINRVIVTAGPEQPRIKAGVAVAIVRDCLAALAALHREKVIHGDIKPSNIMLKRTGNGKIVDMGSAFELSDPPLVRTCTPKYAAPEVLENQPATARSDLASLGYVLVEMLSGRPLFVGQHSCRDLLEAKRALPYRLAEILPEEVVVNDLLMNFCQRLVAADPMKRFSTAEDAELLNVGAAGFQRQLILGNMAAEYGNEIRLWVEELKEVEEREEENATE